MAAASETLQMQLAREIARYTHDPLGFSRFAFPWGEKGLAGAAGPRAWQADIQREIGEHLQNPATRHQPLRIAVSSGHGIGKSAEIAMLLNWATSTCEMCKCVVTAGTGTQLATKTVPEVTKWFHAAINRSWWDVNATSIRFASQKLQANWRTDFITWSERNTEPFAGLHNLRKRIVVVFDEASAIANKVWEVTEGALTDENTEIIWLAFGNPTRNTGAFRECFGKHKHRWKTYQIDSRNVEGTNKVEIAKWIADYGEDSDFVRVRVRGEFPRAGSTQFISSDDVQMCRQFKAVGYESLPKILSVDVARFGDDQTVMGVRQGRKLRILAKYRGLDTVQVAERAIEHYLKETPEAIVVDGDGLGAGVIDQIRHRGFGERLFEFHGGTTANDPQAYFNKRAECWGLMREWLKEGAEIPDDPELASDLSSPEYGFSNKSQIQLERKEDMKARGLSSPDCGDMLAMTFGVTVAPQPRREEPAYLTDYESRELAWMG